MDLKNPTPYYSDTPHALTSHSVADLLLLETAGSPPPDQWIAHQLSGPGTQVQTPRDSMITVVVTLSRVSEGSEVVNTSFSYISGERGIFTHFPLPG